MILDGGLGLEVNLRVRHELGDQMHGVPFGSVALVCGLITFRLGLVHWPMPSTPFVPISAFRSQRSYFNVPISAFLSLPWIDRSPIQPSFAQFCRLGERSVTQHHSRKSRFNVRINECNSSALVGCWVARCSTQPTSFWYSRRIDSGKTQQSISVKSISAQQFSDVRWTF